MLLGKLLLFHFFLVTIEIIEFEFEAEIHFLGPHLEQEKSVFFLIFKVFVRVWNIL